MSSLNPARDASVATPASPLRRARGQLRMEVLLAAAAQVFANKGFEAATMTEIAAQANSAIGSLYQFFRTKQAVAEALVRSQLQGLWARFDALAVGAPALSDAQLAARLAGMLTGFRAAHPSFAQLVETPATPLALAAEVRGEVRARLAALLQARAPALAPGLAQAMAAVVQQAMKAALQLQADGEGAARAAALAELETMLATYLALRLDRARGVTDAIG